MAKQYLSRICSNNPSIEIEDIDILRHPLRLFHDGVRMIPTVKIGNEQLSGFYLTEVQLANFIEKHQ
jgi:hypothetical protein